VIAHRAASPVRIPIIDRRQNLQVFARGHLAKVGNVNPGQQDALHLSAGFMHRLEEHLISGELGDLQVKSSVCLDEAQTTRAVFAMTRDLGQFTEPL
jgi:hypothetical protein